MPERVVLVEDDQGLREFLGEVLEDSGFEVAAFATAESALAALRGGLDCDVVLTDLVLPGTPGQELLGAVRRSRPEVNVLVMTAFGSIASAIELVRAGAYDYLTKPVESDELVAVLRRALDESAARRRAAAELREAASGGLAGFVGASRALRDVFTVVLRAAGSRHPVLITGESGTGKELVARALHERSGRHGFVSINCGALPESLLESELFGHEKGAFTGADRAKEGLFEAASGGTLFLDEIGELSLSLQPKLLRVLEEAEIRRVGSTRSRAVDVRVIAATNRDLEADVAAGRFRDDLFWRLNVIHIHVPPLRERPADIAALAEHFLGEAAASGDGRPKSLSAEAMAVLTAYPWPGNARELRNAIHRAATLAARDLIGVDDLPPRIRGIGEPAALTVSAAERQMPLREVERLYIMEVLRRTEGNKTRAAEVLGLDRKTLYRKLEEYAQDIPG